MSSAHPSTFKIADRINRHYLTDEAHTIERLLPMARTSAKVGKLIGSMSRELVEKLRRDHREIDGLHAFLQHYDLSSNEGVVLMCLAEALLRIPDQRTVDAFIADKLVAADWRQHLGESESLFVNASTWALMLTGDVLKRDRAPISDLGDLLNTLLSRIEKPLLRASLRAAMKIMAAEFVMGRTIKEALSRATTEPFRRYRFSYDMLGEAALTEQNADASLSAYLDAIAVIGETITGDTSVAARPSISVKLSALYPRFEVDHQDTAVRVLSDRMLIVARAAASVGVGLTLDAEEADRLEMSLRVFERVYRNVNDDPDSSIGIAVQAYQKRALDVLQWLHDLSVQSTRVIPVRLVKGAYWDTEIKRAQELGLSDYPVFTNKQNTDVSYLACVQFLLANSPYLYAQFATHNAHTVSYIYCNGRDKSYEFQRLHGMGEDLYDSINAGSEFDVPCRVYAPVGAHEDLLPYLVRRLLENGANTSFVNQIVQSQVSPGVLIADPVALVESDSSFKRNPRVPLPRNLYQPDRLNSSGINFSDQLEVQPILDAIDQVAQQHWRAAPFVGGVKLQGQPRLVTNPADHQQNLGEVRDANQQAADMALASTAAAFPNWDRFPASKRAEILERAAALFESKREELIALSVLEAGKTLRDGASEVREAIDFLRYYAAEGRRLFSCELLMPGPTGESNHLRWRGRGVFACISPWNFPIAIFVGQIAAALMAGNSVIAKPAEQTSIAAWRVCELLYEAGVPNDVLAFLPGDGEMLGKILLGDARVAGVAMTGSIETARAINRTLASRDGALATLIAETGGVNFMLADSSALPEHVVRDVVSSAFNSAGQRCSALRVLCVQEEIAPRVLELLIGFLTTWKVGNPAVLDTDMGPVIDSDVQNSLEAYIESASDDFTLLFRGRNVANGDRGYFVTPAIIEVGSVKDLRREVFGPVLHVLRYKSTQLFQVVEDINDLGYGLTVGIQSRIEQRTLEIRDHLQVGNVYVNRNMIGAVVGVQPFGGCGLSGTGPKAGGPHYLLRFATEQTFTVNTAAIGGNVTLVGNDASLASEESL